MILLLDNSNLKTKLCTQVILVQTMSILFGHVVTFSSKILINIGIVEYRQ